LNESDNEASQKGSKHSNSPTIRKTPTVIPNKPSLYEKKKQKEQEKKDKAKKRNDGASYMAPIRQHKYF